MEQLRSGNCCIPTAYGCIKPEELGYTLMHEHLIVQPQIVNEIYEPYSLIDKDKAISDIKDIYNKHISSLIDMTPINYGRNVKMLRDLQCETGLKILVCTGFHKELFMPDYVKNKSIDELSSIIIDECLNGIDGLDIFPSVIKCGSSKGIITENEKKAIRAAALASNATGLPISTHCDKGTMALEQAHILIEHGVDPKKILLGHVDLSENYNVITNLMKLGVNVMFDHIGRTRSHDAFVVDTLLKIRNDYGLDHIFLSQDMGKKDYLKSYGGKPGLDYIMGDFKVRYQNDISDDDFAKMLCSNPKEFLTI